MNTPAISNLTNVTSALTPATPAAKQPATSSDTQFNQMLSRGIEQRRNFNEPSKPVAKESSPAKQVSQSTQSAAATNDANAGEESTSTSIHEEAAVAPAAETPAGPTKSRTESDAESEDDKAALAASSDELLALVASLTQASTVSADASKNAPVDGAAQPAAVDATAAATAIAASAPGAKSADLTSGIDASASAPAQAAGKADAAAQVTLTALPKRIASEAATPEASEAAKKFDASLAQVKDHKDAADANAAPAHAPSNKNDPTAATLSGPELRAAKAAVDPQPAAAPINLAPQSPVSMQYVQAAAAAAADKLTPRVGSNNWDQALGQKVVWMAAGEQQSASLTLNPPDLGPLQVVLSVSNSQATVNFTAAQPEVRQALENAMPKLREMLGDAGIQLGQANVSAGTPNNQQGGFGERQHASRGTGPRIDDDANAPVHTVRSQTITSGGQGLVDTFA